MQYSGKFLLNFIINWIIFRFLYFTNIITYLYDFSALTNIQIGYHGPIILLIFLETFLYAYIVGTFVTVSAYFINLFLLKIDLKRFIYYQIVTYVLIFLLYVFNVY